MQNNPYFAKIGRVTKNTVATVIFGNQTCQQHSTESFSILIEGSIIIYQIIQYNSYGIKFQDVYIFRASSGEQLIPHVYPAVELILFAPGKTKSRRLLKLISTIQTVEHDLNRYPTEYWLRQNARLQTRTELILPWQEKASSKKICI